MAKASPSAAPTLTMEELLSQSGQTIQVPKTGNIVSGKIIDITKKMVLIDVGGKTEGMVVDREFQQAKEFIETLKPGETVDVYVLDGENENGQILLSLKKAAMNKKWDEFTAMMERGDVLTVKAFDVNRGGMVVLLDGVRGFIPSSQFGRAVAGRLPALKGKDIQAKLLEVDKEKNRLIFSERLVSEAEELANSQAALKHIEEGAVVDGTITGIKPFGMFMAVEVEVEPGKKGLLEGLVHISEVSWEKVEDLNALYKKGQAIKAKVLVVDEQQGKLTLSIKQLQEDPWNKVADEFPVGATITGEVSRVVPFGVFITIAPGVDGLIHNSKMSSSEVYRPGDRVTVSVDSVDVEQHRVSLSPAAKELPVTYK